MSTRYAATLAVLGALMSVTGCVSYRNVTAAELTPRTELDVRFAAPRFLVFESAGGYSVAFDDVVRVQGRMIAITSDSMTIATTRANLSRARVQRFGAGTTTTFAVANAHIQELRYHKGRMLALVTVLALGFLLLIVATSDQSFSPSPPPPSK